MKFAQSVVSLSRFYKRLVSILIDVLGLLFIAVLAVWLRLGEVNVSLAPYVMAIVILPLIALLVMITQGLYRAVIRYIGHRFALTVFRAVSLTFLIWATTIFMLDLDYPRSAILIAWLSALFYVAFTRIVARWMLSDWLNKTGQASRQPIVIFGAGDSGKQLLSAMAKSSDYKVVGFIDDDAALKKQEVLSVKVCPRQSLQNMIEHFAVKEVFLAIPSLSKAKRKAILEWLESYPVKVKTLPGLDEIVSGKVSFSDVREVEIGDLLGRDQVPPRSDLLEECIKDQVVMISGAGGSIGSELCRQVIRQKPKMLVLYELSEFALYQIDKELEAGEVEVVAILGSVLNADKLHEVFQQYSVNTVYHAAAYKHVPIVEHNIAEGIRNNTFGTLNLAKIAAEHGVQNFVLISTDKAVRPTNFMGASKRMAEMALQALQDEFTHTRFTMVRFGNVLGSSGSVIPLFRKQIAQGGPVTVTHKEITRYFMTIHEAASLVIQAGSMGTGGDVFVLDMGEPVKIADLAKHIVKLSGLSVVDAHGEGDIEIQFTGLRPGEKLYEELLIGDNVDGTDHPKIMKAHEYKISFLELEVFFDKLEKALVLGNYEHVKELIGEVVTGFNHHSDIVDYLSVK
jgi:FlaA1/EpsC-like NDP-sugar epimerase